MGLYFFVELKCQSNTITLSLGVEYSMRDLNLRRQSLFSVHDPQNCNIKAVIDVSASFMHQHALASCEIHS